MREGDQSDRLSDIDRRVGERIRERRILLGLTQERLAARLAVSYQQLHKYESGENRLSAGRLYQLAVELNVPVSYFFDGVEAPDRPPSERDRLVLQTARAIAGIGDPEAQRILAELARFLSAQAPPQRGRPKAEC
jgi:transcriptional regulator with XRE-family HTH domain